MTSSAQRCVFQSSLIASVTYSSEATLEVQFRKGTTYRYFAVPPAVFRDLCTAQSAGAFFNTRIKDHYPFQHVA